MAAVTGCGITLTLGPGNRVVCDIIEQLGAALVGREIEELMAEFGAVSKRLADDPALRWLGPHKGAVHLALASLVNACFDLWAKARGVPLWRLLLDLTPAQVVALLDLSYVEDVLSKRGRPRHPVPPPVRPEGARGYSAHRVSRLRHFGRLVPV